MFGGRTVQVTRSILVALLVAPLVAPLVACGDDGGTGPQEPVFAHVRIINAVLGSSNVQVLRAGATAPVATLSFRQYTAGCVDVPAGTRTLTFQSEGTTLATVEATFGAEDNWSVILTAANGTYRAVALSDVHTATIGNNALRFINASSSPGDVYATDPNAEPGPTTLAAGNLGPLAMSNEEPPYLARPTTDTRIRFYDVGVATDTPRGDITLRDVGAQRLATVVFTDPSTPPGVTTFIVLPCERPASAAAGRRPA
jgi:hypothetical protein